MNKVYIVRGQQYGKVYYGYDNGIIVGIYDNKEAAKDHEKFIREMDNDWYAHIEFTQLQSNFQPDRVTGLRSLTYEDFYS